jgi:hypothetical protein
MYVPVISTAGVDGSGATLLSSLAVVAPLALSEEVVLVLMAVLEAVWKAARLGSQH